MQVCKRGRKIPENNHLRFHTRKTNASFNPEFPQQRSLRFAGTIMQVARLPPRAIADSERAIAVGYAFVFVAHFGKVALGELLVG